VATQLMASRVVLSSLEIGVISQLFERSEFVSSSLSLFSSITQSECLGSNRNEYQKMFLGNRQLPVGEHENLTAI
jgi:hypothetical protein